MGNTRTIARLLQVALAASLLSFGAGCRKQDTNPATTSNAAAPSDQQMAADLTSKLNSEGALSGQSIQSTVENGQATLTGTVTDEASRTLASRDAGSIAGVKTVINNLTIVPSRAAVAAAPAPVPSRRMSERERRQSAQSAPPAPAPVPQQQDMARTPEAVRVVPPPAPARPVTRTVTLATGTTIPIRMTDELQTGKTQPNDTFHGTLAADLTADGVTAIPRGAVVLGRVVDAKDATHYAGSSMLTIELTQVSYHGQTFHLVTDPYSQQGKSRGGNTAKKVGGGAALGAVIGALAGGGLGAGANTITRGEQVTIASETLINFRLQSPIPVTVTTQPRSNDGGDAPAQQDPTLQQR